LTNKKPENKTRRKEGGKEKERGTREYSSGIGEKRKEKRRLIKELTGSRKARKAMRREIR
jgi:hypothetical protein